MLQHSCRRRFRGAFAENIKACQLVLALIGPNWLKVSNASGVRRIEDPSDFVRMELTAALCKSIKLVPVLIDGASMPSEAELPLPLKPLGKLQAIELRNSQFRWDAARLLEKLFEALGQSPRLRRQLKWLAAAIALSALGTAWSAIEYGWFGLTPRSMWIWQALQPKISASRQSKSFLHAIAATLHLLSPCR